MQKTLVCGIGAFVGVFLASGPVVAKDAVSSINYSKKLGTLHMDRLYELETYSVKNRDDISVFAGMSPEKNQISIFFFESREHVLRTKETATEICSSTINQIKEDLGMQIYKKTKKMVLQLRRSPFPNHEKHSIGEAIDEATIIGGQILFANSTVECKSSLLNKKVVFATKKMESLVMN
ncbi:MAG: hypothetical protein HQM11_04070 [SAR324 cluster bacterium]|nr:hypothetical protein [SAR324 cluster bacterium]